MRRIIILFAIIMYLHNAWIMMAQNNITIYGDLQDGFLKTPLQDTKVSLLSPDSTVIIERIPLTEINTTGSNGGFSHYVADIPAAKGRYLIRFTLDGYGVEWQAVEITNLRKKEIPVPMTYMFRRQTIGLGEIGVTATRIKMFWRGDTIVYDATAFKLPDGSMLDNLIRQLPGAEIKDNGEIYINGRKIDELLLGSRSFMRDKKKILLENLPYYTVNKLKVYEKESDMSKALGHDTGAKTFVMDVDLKKEYQTGMMGNTEAAGGTEHRWLGRAFLMGFTDLWRFTLLGNANNVNETRHAGETGYWTPVTMPINMITTRSITAGADYASKNKNVKNNLTADYVHLTTATDLNRRQETFLQSLTPLTLTESRQVSKSYTLKVHDYFTLLKPLYIAVEGDFKREKVSGQTASTLSQWGDTLTARMLTTGLDEGSTTSVLISASGMKSVNPARHQDIGLNLIVMHNNNSIGNASHYRVTQDAVHTDRCNTNSILNRINELKIGANYNQKLALRWNLRSGISYDIHHTKAHDYLYHPDTITLPSQLTALNAITDGANSYRYSYARHSGTLSLTLVNSILTQLVPGVNISSEQLSIKLDIPLL